MLKFKDLKKDDSWKDRTRGILEEAKSIGSLGFVLSGMSDSIEDLEDEEILMLKKAKKLFEEVTEYSVDWAEEMDSQKKAIKKIEDDVASIKEMLKNIEKEIKESKK